VSERRDTDAVFASGLSQHPVASQATGEVAGAALEQLAGARPDLVVCFASSDHVGAVEDVFDALVQILEPEILLGATVGSVIGGDREVEDEPALSVFAAALPSTRLTPLALTARAGTEGTEVHGWPDDDLGTEPHGDRTLLMLADPFSLPVDGFLRSLDERARRLPVIGGLASAARQPGGNRLALGRGTEVRVEDHGAVGVVVEGGVELRALVSQGCRPIGRPYIVTRAEGGLLQELGGEPAVDRLRALVAEVTDADRDLIRRGLHVGVVVDEHLVEFGPGDFLVRNVLGADPDSGAIAVGEHVRVGQTVQFHVRDATAADEDLHAMLAGQQAGAALLFSCNGRGRHLFGTADHDAAALTAHLGPIPLAGAFCAGEIGPVGSRSFLHGFTASLALFG
jgi:small ligand-binding sensory domain FIST